MKKQPEGETKKRTGRPSSFNQEQADEICKRLSEGETLTKIVKSEGMPALNTIYRWSEANEAFRKQYARARDEFYRRMADDVMDHSDDAKNDFTVDEHGKRVVNHENIQRSRLRVDTRKWLLSKMLPKLYGDKIELSGKLGHEVSGPDGGALQLETTLSKLGVEELRAFLEQARKADAAKEKP
jgi:hypothetical protein